MNKIFSPFLLFVFFICNAHAYENKEISLPSGLELSYTGYENDSKTLIVWIPSEYGTSPELVETALSIADKGFDLWVLKLHESYMVSPGRNSISQFRAEDIYQLMRAAKKQGYEKIVISAANRGAVLALNAGRLWQLKHPDNHDFVGFIFLHPHLIEGAVEMGDDARYLSIARSVNKPVFILQPEYTPKYLHTGQVIQQLKAGGAAIKVVVLEGVAAGFHARPEDELTADDLAMRHKIGSYFNQGFNFLASARQPQKAVQLENNVSSSKTFKRRVPTLYPYKGNPVAPPLVLNDINGKGYDLQHFKGKVVLINFWASWCRPCVREIPSLNRLVKKMHGKDFQLLTVDIKEPAEKINAFFDDLLLEHHFPVLMDTDGQASVDWKVYAYPSNYLLDSNGRIRYGYTGALEWDEQEIIRIIESLL